MKQTIVIGATSGSAVALPNGLRLRAVKSAPGIRVTDIRPGLVDTAMAKGEGLFWVMPVGRVVEQVLRAVRRGRRVAGVTGPRGVGACPPRWPPESVVSKIL